MIGIWASSTPLRLVLMSDCLGGVQEQEQAETKKQHRFLEARNPKTETIGILNLRRPKPKPKVKP
jgi:hypothetical protein